MKNKLNIAMLGGRGYVGQEIISILDNHPNLNLTKVFSSSNAGAQVKNSSNKDLKFSLLNKSEMNIDDVDVVILAMPNGKAKSYFDLINKINNQIIFIDISSDFRTDNAWHYRLPELRKYNGSKTISNPGCYATAMQLSIAPIMDLVDGDINSIGISGYSGAGATPNSRNNQSKLENNLIPYSLSGHAHENEVRNNLYKQIHFSPHVASFFRGILVTSKLKLKKKNSVENIFNMYKNFYENSKLINIKKDIPMINEIINTHTVEIGGFSLDENKQHLTLCCTLDNLLKGAATQVIQNINAACGFDDLTGINYE